MDPEIKKILEKMQLDFCEHAPAITNLNLWLVFRVLDNLIFEQAASKLVLLGLVSQHANSPDEAPQQHSTEPERLSMTLFEEGLTGLANKNIELIKLLKDAQNKQG